MSPRRRRWSDRARSTAISVYAPGRLVGRGGRGPRRRRSHWFAEAARQGPSLPYAHIWNGRRRAKLARGDLKGAAAGFGPGAGAAGPRFADASEAAGEALLASGDAVGAAARFGAAAQYAPNWGRLHLKWGEALAGQGRAADARAQFRVAAGLYLSAPDRAELAAQKV